MPKIPAGSSAPDLYTDAAAPEPGMNEEAAPKEEAPETQEPTAEIPKSILGGQDFAPGDKVILQVVKTMGDSVLVKYASEGEEPEEPAAPAAPAPGGGGQPSIME